MSCNAETVSAEDGGKILRPERNRKEMLDRCFGFAKSAPSQADRKKRQQTNARRKNPRAWGSSPLNRRIRFHISKVDAQQAEIYEPPEEFRKILTKRLRLDVEFAQQLLISNFNSRRRCHHLPHARTDFIQTVIAFRFEIE